MVLESEVIFFLVVPIKADVHHMHDVYGSVPSPILNSPSIRWARL